MTTMTRTGGAWVAALVALAMLPACGYGGATDRAGQAAPVKLRLGTPDVQGAPGAHQIEEFARQVKARSAGSLLIEPVWGKDGGNGLDDWDQVAARQVADGKVDLALVPARAWDVLGVTTLRTLNAPFLLTTEPAVDAVVRSEVAGDLLAGLDKVGVTGLGLVPESLRHVFFVGDSPPAMANLAGHVVRAPRSETVYAFFTALGARPDDFGDDAERVAAAVADGTLVAYESSFNNAAGIDKPTTAVGNVTLFPKVNSLVANSDAFADLSEEHRSVLRAASGATVDWAIAKMPSEVDAAAQYCRDGGRIVVDSSATAIVQAAGATVVGRLADDAGTAKLMRRIRSMVGSTAAGAEIQPCGRKSAGEAGTVRTQGEFPEGIYRKEVSETELRAAGVDPIEATHHAGVWTMQFTGGTLKSSDVNDATGKKSEGTGVYCVKDGRVVLGILDSPPRCGDFWSAAWKVEGDTLRFVDVTSGHGSQNLIQAVFGGTPFIKIG